MKELEVKKEKLKEQVKNYEKNNFESVVSIGNCENYLTLIKESLTNKVDHSMKTEVIKQLVHKVEIDSKEVLIYFYTGAQNDLPNESKKRSK